METKSLLRTKRSLWLPILALLLLLGSIVNAQTVSTDKADYAPGETVYINGTGFWPGEEVELFIEHIEPNLPDPWHTHDVWAVSADKSGNFYSSWYVDERN